MMSEQINQEYIYELAVSPDGNAQFSAQSSGLYRFDGRVWRNALASLNVEPFAVTAVRLSPDYAIDHSVWAGASGTILRSVDGGDSWEAFRLPAPPPVITSLTLAPDYASSGAVYAATLEDGVWVSQDRGMHWDAWNFGLIGFGVNMLAVKENKIVYAGTELGVFQSNNGGRSWGEVALFDVPVTALALANTSLWVGTEGLGLWQLRDDSRVQIAPDVVGGTVEAIISDGSNLLILCDNELLLSRDHGAGWHAPAPGTTVLAMAALNGLGPGTTVVAAGEDGRIQTLDFS